jgi:RNA polymerase sigma-70 factor, ECF subfamily
MKSLKGNLQEKIVFLKLRSGDSDAFAFFYEQYVTRIYRFVFIKVSDKRVAEEITQDIFLKVWQHVVDKKHIKSFQAFIFRIARNSVIDYYRQASRQELPLDYVEDSLAEDEQTESKMDKSLDSNEILGQIKKLKNEYQEIILLRYVEDLSIEEISQVLQKDKNNVRVTLHRALNKLKSISSKK